jgi:hypothetical protein
LSEELQRGETFENRPPAERRGAVTGGRREKAKECEDAGRENCMDEVRNFIVNAVQQVFPGDGQKDKEKRENMVKKEMHRQKVDSIGGHRANCMKASEGTEERDTVKKRCEQAACQEVAGDSTLEPEEGSCKGLFENYCVSLRAEAADLCSGIADDQQSCRDEYADEAEAAGCSKSDKGNQRRLANRRVAAQRWADCGDTADCEDVAKDVWLALSAVAEGAADSAWAGERGFVERLARAEREGIPTVLRFLPAVDVLVEVQEGACSDGAMAETLDDVLPEGIVESECLDLDGGRARLMRRIRSDGDVEQTLSDALAGIDTLPTARRLGLRSGERRLASVVVTDRSASQSTEECFEDDTSCGTLSETTEKTTKASDAAFVFLSTSTIASLMAALIA